MVETLLRKSPKSEELIYLIYTGCIRVPQLADSLCYLRTEPICRPITVLQ